VLHSLLVLLQAGSSLLLTNIPDGASWTLASTLIDPQQVTKRELFVLYRQRWHVELDLRSIKSVMQMDLLRCKSPEMVEKEIAAHLVRYNLVRAVMAQAAFLSAVLPRQFSFTTALQILNAFEQNLRCYPRGRLLSHSFQVLDLIYATRCDFGAICGDRPDYLANLLLDDP